MDLNLADPSNEEIWDDSMLIDSWNQALAEFKKYHSIHAKGGSIKALERDDHDPSNKGEVQLDHSDRQEQRETEAPKGTASITTDRKEEEAPLCGTRDQPSSQTAGASPPTFPSQAILGSVGDEGFKKLLMSWYYAGYYTGLYEGQQQAQQQQQR